MPRIHANGIELEYEDHGTPDAPVILLVMGLGAQLTLWPIELVEALVERGFRVIRYDNRDIGLSHKFEGVRAPGFMRTALMKRFGFTPRTPYTLTDMADDGAALLEALDIPGAHVVGASMGGMIAQLIAVNHPEKTTSLTSIMSTTGNPKLPMADKDAMRALTARPPSMEHDVLVEHGMGVARAIGSPDYPTPEARLRERTAANVTRSVYPQGMQRQLAAIIADGDRRKRLRAVTAPTLVIHGEADPLVKCEGGRDTAAAIPGAQLKIIPGMGHDLPLELVEEIADAIVGHARAV
ncbi:alpha/beta fold hydrolase [Qipengyuania marisflavi]|uniref:Alpha/beta fold hydrolase n=1 Tax=Qipengyuania marisflavi TaxID=2486356 RepID=A0A5S3P654_9SPHN|nr:alpha/beta fold hydrolase [Qipengyuania marisflavi]TMM48426.1 alpha/beta fold hydrolase [Qipengyuania marisflavi]